MKSRSIAVHCALLVLLFLQLHFPQVLCSSATLTYGCSDCINPCDCTNPCSTQPFYFYSGGCFTPNINLNINSTVTVVPIATEIICASPNSSSPWVASMYANSWSCSGVATRVYTGTGSTCTYSFLFGFAVGLHVDCSTASTTATPTASTSTAPTSAATTTTSDPTAFHGTWIKASLSATTCDYECSALGRVCVESPFRAITSTTSMLAIATQANFTCPLISAGNPLLHEDPEFDPNAATCFYGGGVGTCNGVGDVNNYRFCPCSFPSTTKPPTTPTPTTSPPTSTLTGFILQSYEFSFSFFEVAFTSTPFRVTSSTQHADALVPALASMKGVAFHLVSGPTTTVTYSLCEVEHGGCTVVDQVACDTDDSTSAGSCGSRLFIPLQQTNVMLRVKAGNQVFAFSVYEQMIH